eukprot:SAG22_NODE_1233_length_5065_cov_12.050141_2_plen_103_part_00
MAAVAVEQQPVLAAMPMDDDYYSMQQQPPPMDAGTPLDFLLSPSPYIAVRQSIELFEAITGFETANKYEIIGTSSKDGQSGASVFFRHASAPVCPARRAGDW